MVKIFNEMKTYNCPICHKPGLEDYRKKEVKCPTCGSDLSVFVDLKKTTLIGNKLKFTIFITFCIISILSIFLILSSLKSNENLYASIVRSNELSDSLALKENIIMKLTDSLKTIQQAQEVDKESISNLYIVKRGDSFCLISNKLFGTEKYAKDIAEINGKNINALIFPDTKLLIPQK